MQLEKEKETREAAERCRLLAQRIAEELAPEAAVVLAADEESGALLEKALGEATVTLRAERMGPDVLALLPGSVSGSAMVQAVCSPAGYSAEQLRFFAKFRKKFIGIEYTGRDISSTKARVLAAFGEDLRRPRRCPG